MKAFLRALFIAGLMVSPALAAENIQQNSDGSTVWVNPLGQTIGVGSGALFVSVSNMAEPSTYYIISPVRGIIREVMTVLGQASSTVTTGAANVVTILVAKAASQAGADGTNPTVNFKQLSGYTTVNLTIAVGSSAGQTDVMGLATYATPSRLINNTVDQYGVIAVNTDGGNSDNREMRVMIRIDPY
jgi:hypothetical protein